MALIPIIVAGGVTLYVDTADSNGISVVNDGVIRKMNGYVSGDSSEENIVTALAGPVVDTKKTMLSWTQDAGINGGVDYYQRYQPSEAGSVAWHQGKFELSNSFGARHNQVWTAGWNMNPNGGRVVEGSETACGIGFEAYYSPASSPGPYMEQHLYFVTAAGVQRRPISWLMDRVLGEIQGAIECERLTFYNQGGALQTMVINPSQTLGTVVLGRFNQLPVTLRFENNNSTAIVQRDSNNADAEIARVNNTNEVVIANGGNNTRIGGPFRIKVLPVANLSGGGAIGTAAATVDLYSSFDVNQTTAGQTISLPTPALATTGLEVSVSNVGSQSFTMLSATVAAGASLRAKWTGAAWSKFS